MKNTYSYDGVQFRTSKAGNAYADLFLREVDENGNIDLQQRVFRSFNEDVINRCRSIEPNSVVIVDLTIKEAFVDGISDGIL